MPAFCALKQVSMASPPDLVVLSDLHLGEGLSAPPRYSPMEDFFYDGEFRRLLDHLRWEYSDPDSLVLVLNGDVFDFLTVTCAPDHDEAERLGLRVSSAERRFGLNPTPAKSVYKLDRIIDGHPAFFGSLARFLAAGFRVEILRGNHDLELHFEAVRARLIERLCAFEGGPTRAQTDERLGYHEWYYLEEGRVYIEHGNQYESSNSIRYPLRPVLPKRQARRERGEPVLDYPLGSYFVRFFYNAIHAINPHTPKVISFEQYLEFLRRHNLLDLLRIARDHGPFFTRAVTTGVPGGSKGSAEVAGEQERVLQAVEEESAGHDFHRELDALKIHPMVASKAALAKQMTKPVLRRLAWVAGLSLATLYVWLLVFNLIQATPFADNVFAEAILLVFFALLTGVGLVGFGNHFARKMRRNTDEVVEMCADRAEKIARLTGVKLVLMGHTHVVDVRPILDGAGTYANSGTWTSVDNPWDRLHPDARRFTFLRVRGAEVEVIRWNDDANRIASVPLFDLPGDRELEVGALGDLATERIPPKP